ncbi:MAG: hypothetical protein PHV99_03635 [Candidatus Pacebacteria bacterium]|nr:hypothetical protein [Candidatus Paceibacterota bacterium]
MNRIILAVALFFAAPAFAGDCFTFNKKQYCETKKSQPEPVAMPEIPAPPQMVVVVQQPLPPCLPPSGWVVLPDGNHYCQPPAQYAPVPVASPSNSNEYGSGVMTGIVGTMFVGALLHNTRGHDVVYINRGGRHHW